MTAARESTDAQWEAYYAARAYAHRAQAVADRAYAVSLRLHPLACIQSEADGYDELAAECDRLADELMGETA